MSVCAWNFKRNLGADILSGFIAHIFAKACTKNKIPSRLKKMLLYYHLQSLSFKFLRTAFRFVILSDFLPSSSFSLNHMIIDIIIIYLSFIIVIFTNIITSTKKKHCDAVSDLMHNLSCKETRFQKCYQSGKNGSNHPMLSISMAFNVISCKKVERNTQKLKIADFTM